MSMLFGNHQQISPWTLYSTIGPSTCVSGYVHAQNDLLYLSHVYSMSQNLLIVHIFLCISPVLNLDSAPPTCSQNLVWALSSLLTSSLSHSPKFRTRRRWVAQHIHWGKSPILIQVLLLGILLHFYICLVQISTLSKLHLSFLCQGPMDVVELRDW